jgi:hypothetical protein
MVSVSNQLFKIISYPGHLLMGLLQAVVGPTVSAVAVAGLCFTFHPEDRSLLFWIVIAPILYLAWLTILLLFYTLETSLLGLVYEKPGRIHEKEDGLLNLPFMVSVYLYGRAYFLFTLPFVLQLVHVPLYRWLIYRSYATRDTGRLLDHLWSFTDPSDDRARTLSWRFPHYCPQRQPLMAM